MTSDAGSDKRFDAIQDCLNKIDSRVRYSIATAIAIMNHCDDPHTVEMAREIVNVLSEISQVDL